jgi:hypothetical protein
MLVGGVAKNYKILFTASNCFGCFAEEILRQLKATKESPNDAVF